MCACREIDKERKERERGNCLLLEVPTFAKL